MDLIPLESFQERLKADLETILRASGKRDWSDALAEWVGQHFLDLTPEEARRACAMQGPGEEGVDLFYRSRGQQSIAVGQAEAHVDLRLNDTYPKKIVSKIDRALRAMNDATIVANPRHVLSEAAKEYQEGRAKGYAVAFWVIVPGKASIGLDREISKFRRTTLALYPRHSIDLIDAGALLAKYCAEVQRAPAPTVIVDTLPDEMVRHDPNSWYASLSGASIALAVQQTHLSLFESNARLPLVKATVNEEIERTLDDPKQRRFFWDYNNGITILCEKLEPVSKTSIRLVGAQIVNGCQTAYTLFRSADKLIDVSVPAKIIVGADPTLSQNIRRTTNRQTAVEERDLRSGDAIQIVLQDEFQHLGYFYQRKGPEYANAERELGKIHLRREFRNGKVDNVNLAQLSLAFWHQLPSSAKMERQKLFRRKVKRAAELESGFYDLVFHKYVRANELLLPFLVYQRLYNEFNVGYRGQDIAHGGKYRVLTHGNQTILAAVGRLLQARYAVKGNAPNTPQKEMTLRKLVQVFSDPESEHEEYLGSFDRAIETIVGAIRRFVEAEVHRRRAAGQSPDIRVILVSEATYQNLVDNRQFDASFRRAVKELPPLT
jgi:hypothetical protein